MKSSLQNLGRWWQLSSAGGRAPGQVSSERALEGPSAPELPEAAKTGPRDQPLERTETVPNPTEEGSGVSREDAGFENGGTWLEKKTQG